MVHNPCAVLLCPMKGGLSKNIISKHSFPKDSETCQRWRTLCGNPALSSISDEKLAQNYIVCGRHFKPCDKKVNNRATILKNKTIVPTLFLPAPLQERSPPNVKYLLEDNQFVLSTMIANPSNVHCEMASFQNLHMKQMLPTLDFNERLSKINFSKVFPSDQSGIEYLPVYLPGEKLEMFDEDKIVVKPEVFEYVVIESSKVPQEFCRTCSKECGNTEVEIFGEKGKELRLEEKIHKHLPIKVQEDDILPLHMCANCVQQLDAFDKMFLTCSAADKTLKDMFNCSDDPLLITNDKFYETSTNDKISDMSDSSNHYRDDFQDFFPCNANTSKTEFTIDEDTKKEKAEKRKKENKAEKSVSNIKKIKRSYKKSVLYTCPVCSNTIEGRVNFDVHLVKVHSKYQCEICYFIFDTISDLNSHRLNNHKRECTICSVTFTYRRELYSHMSAVHADVKPFKCELCEAVFPLEEMLIKHKQMHKYVNISQIYECNDCGEKYNSHTDLKSHLKIHLTLNDERRTHLCELCGKNYTSNSKLQYHMKIHTNDMNYKCDKCPKKFNYAFNLRVHKEVHNKIEYKCSKCPVKYKHKRDLDLHTRKHHTGQWYYQCIMCPSKFNSEQEVHAHFETHSNRINSDSGIFKKISDVQCSICDRYFLNKTTLRIHNKKVQCKPLKIDENPESQLQENITNFMCKTCGKYLASNSSLKNHSLTHLETDLFDCAFCSRGFKSKQSLIDHIRLHTGEKPFECDICYKMFTRKQDVSRHKNFVHFDIRNYKCNVCSKAFKSSSKLNVHFRIHTGERPYKCDVCSRTFIQGSDIVRHKRITNHQTNTTKSPKVS